MSCYTSCILMRRNFYLGLLILGSGMLIGWMGNGVFNGAGTLNASDFQEKHAGGYKFISPLLECTVAEKLITNDLLPFRGKLNALVADLDKRSDIDNVAVYFRDLNNGAWMGINETWLFSPASLLKMPIMVAAFKQAESDPAFLEKKIVYTGPDDNGPEYFKPTVSLKQGQSYTIEELIEHMIIYSDNNAKDLILKDLDINILSDAFTNLGVEQPVAGKTENFIDVQSYSSFFRILFNASYLSKTYSEKALEILSRTAFQDGLVAGVRGGTMVAHKFGERDIAGQNQLHDCGIVYYPDHPYALCVMTRGSNFDALKNAIATVSKFVYDQVDAQAKQN